MEVQNFRKPFIHLFSCSTGYYLYDVNTDSILKINSDTYDKLKIDEGEAENEQIQKLKTCGYLKYCILLFYFY